MLPRVIASPRGFFCVLAGYFLLQVIVRLIASPNADLDESEQLVFAQKFAWGYGPQPPLYTWLQIGFFQVFGVSILALSVLKNLLLFATYFFIWAATQRISRNHTVSVIATVSLLFFPQIAWESQRDLTHSVLVTAIAAATLFVFAELLQSRRISTYALLGLCFGFGALANYNYALFAAGLFAAAVCHREFRSAVLSPRILLSLVIAVAIVAPHAAWALDHPRLVFATATKFKVHSDISRLSVVWIAVQHLFGAWLSHVIGVIAAFGVLCWKQVAPFPPASLRRGFPWLFVLSIVASLLIVVLAMIVLKATSFKGRWLQPTYLCVPMLIALVIEPRLDRRAVRRVTGLAALIGLLVLVAIPSRVWLGELWFWSRGRSINAPSRAFAAQMKPAISRADVILAADCDLGGNLRLAFPNKLVLTPEFSTPERLRNATRAIAIFDAPTEAVPQSFKRFVETLTGTSLTNTTFSYVEARLEHHHDKLMRLGFAEIPLKAPPDSPKP
jgi:4-amino-4-deoxy-L-arabinose transferase-like glycosyltransferase